MRDARAIVLAICALTASRAFADEPHADDRRYWTAAGGVAALHVGLGLWAYFAWYYDRPQLPAYRLGGDRYFDEFTYAGGADKLGHAWATLALARGSTEILRWGGVRPVPAGLVGSGLALTFFALVEVADGFYYELSPGDLMGNTAGAAIGIALSCWPRLDELVDFRLQYFPSPEFRRRLGEGGSVSPATDYSGQTYLLALHLGALPGVRGTIVGDWLRFVDLAGGFESRGYLPRAPRERIEPRSQALFVGLSLNAQGILDAALEGRHGAAGTARTIGHGAFEMLQLPYSTLPVARFERTPPALPPRPPGL